MVNKEAFSICQKQVGKNICAHLDDFLECSTLIAIILVSAVIIGISICLANDTGQDHVCQNLIQFSGLYCTSLEPERPSLNPLMKTIHCP